MRKRVAIRSLTVLILFAGACYVATQGVVWHYPGNMDFALNRSQYEKVVAEVAAQPPGLAQDRTYDFSHDSAASHKTVCASESADGHVLISVVTLESPRGGTYGYLYSNRPFLPEELKPGTVKDARDDISMATCSEKWQVLGSVNDQWMTVVTKREIGRQIFSSTP